MAVAPTATWTSEALDTTGTLGGANRVGDEGTNSATDSPGTAQIARGNGSTGTVQVGAGTSNATGPITPPGGEASTGPGVPASPPLTLPSAGTPAEPTTPRRPVQGAPLGDRKRLRGKPLAAGAPTLVAGGAELRQVARAGSLPFTGLALPFVVLLALGLAAAGAGMRRLATAT